MHNLFSVMGIKCTTQYFKFISVNKGHKLTANRKKKMSKDYVLPGREETYVMFLSETDWC